MTQEEIANQIDKISKQLNIENIKSTMKTEDLLFSLYNKESKRIANMLMAGDVSFGDLNEITAKLDVIKKRLDDKATKAISKSINRSLKNSMKDVRSQITVFKNVLPKEIVDSEIRPEVFRQVFFEAVEAMRILDDGLELSDKIWDINQKALDDIRLYMMEAMINDVSFGEIYHQIKSFLLLPDVDMRTKKWRKFFREHPPGRGVYRSAFKNVMRVLRTETNRAFRLGTVKYAQNRTWVYGLQFMLSAAHPKFDICDEYASQDVDGLGPGIYYPANIPTSAHPHCLCHIKIVPQFDILNIEGLGL